MRTNRGCWKVLLGARTLWWEKGTGSQGKTGSSRSWVEWWPRERLVRTLTPGAYAHDPTGRQGLCGCNEGSWMTSSWVGQWNLNARTSVLTGDIGKRETEDGAQTGVTQPPAKEAGSPGSWETRGTTLSEPPARGAALRTPRVLTPGLGPASLLSAVSGVTRHGGSGRRTHLPSPKDPDRGKASKCACEDSPSSRAP